ncbi:hypothetical protein BB561_003458 [Smittium simulii]|uniref:Core-binding (CB) domain-containing protein n=1 Tax=Smittium simulii TaxID=133385 RepID=A0A2T9YLA2_9FUNG|nr:hypothetical protein BB561_003458 [Smittium simulii]
MESDIKNTTERITGEDKNDNNNSVVKVGNFLSDNTKDQNSRAYKNTGIRDYYRSKKRKTHTLQKQIVNITLDLITSNTRSVKRKSRYYTTQKDFMDWRHSLSISGEIIAPDIINCFSMIFVGKKLKHSTIRAYKSALLQFFIDKEKIKKKNCYKEFMKFLNKSNLIKMNNNLIDIKSIIDHFKKLSLKKDLNTKKLTAKTC